METKNNHINNLLKQIGYKELNIAYNNDKIIINEDVYNYRDIKDVICTLEYYDSGAYEVGGNYNFLNDEAFSLDSKDEMSYLMSILQNSDEIKIELDAVYLLIKDRFLNEKRYLAGIFSNDDDELVNCQNKVKECCNSILEYCKQLNNLEKNEDKKENDSRTEDEIYLNKLMESLLQNTKEPQIELGKFKETRPAEVKRNIVKSPREVILKAGMYFEGLNYLMGWYDLYVVDGSGYLECFSNNKSQKIYFDASDDLSDSYRNLHLDQGSRIRLDTGIKLKLIYLGRNPK